MMPKGCAIPVPDGEQNYLSLVDQFGTVLVLATSTTNQSVPVWDTGTLKLRAAVVFCDEVCLLNPPSVCRRPAFKFELWPSTQAI